MTFIIFISFVIFIRIGELILAKRNEKWALQNGAVEFGQAHYPYIVAMHSLFFLSLIVEFATQDTHALSAWILCIYFVILAFKIWILASLGKFWNTKIFRIPHFPLINKGPYRYFKHPNYMVVVVEIVAIPLVFHLYYSAVIFTLLNAIMLSIRIKEENKALESEPR